MSHVSNARKIALGFLTKFSRHRAPTVANRLSGRPSSPAALLRVDRRSDADAELIRFGYERS